MERVINACNATMPRKRDTIQHPPVYWWNDSIATLRMKCNKTRRLAQRARRTAAFQALEQKHKEAQARLRKAIKRSKKKAFDELLSEVDDNHGVGHTRW